MTILDHLDIVKQRGDTYQCRCPGPLHANGDRKPSLSVTIKGEKILIKCWAGCSATEIVESLGLTLADLFTDEPFYHATGIRRLDYKSLCKQACGEATVLMLAIQDLAQGRETDLDRARLAYKEISRIQTSIS